MMLTRQKYLVILDIFGGGGRGGGHHLTIFLFSSIVFYVFHSLSSGFAISNIYRFLIYWTSSVLCIIHYLV